MSNAALKKSDIYILSLTKSLYKL